MDENHTAVCVCVCVSVCVCPCVCVCRGGGLSPDWVFRLCVENEKFPLNWEKREWEHGGGTIVFQSWPNWISFNFNLTSFFFVLNFVKTIIFVTSACLELNFDNVHCFFSKNLWFYLSGAHVNTVQKKLSQSGWSHFEEPLGINTFTLRKHSNTMQIQWTLTY